MLQSRPFVLKEGVDYRVKVSFKVRPLSVGTWHPPVGSVPLWGSPPAPGTHTAPGIAATRPRAPLGPARCPSRGAASQGGVGL